MPDWDAAPAAAESGDLSKLHFFILSRRLQVDTENNHIMTLLQIASRHSHLDIVTLPIDNGAAINTVKPDSKSALHFMTIRRHISIVRF